MKRRDFLLTQAALLAPFAGFGRTARVAAAADTSGDDEVRDIGSRVEMFVDRWLVEHEQNVSLRLHEPQRREVVLALDQPWEGASSAYYTIFRDGERVRMYYRASGTFQGGFQSPVQFAMAESADGIHFDRPQLRLYEHEGTTANNIVFRHPLAQDNFTPFLDANPEAKPEQRYKAIFASGAGTLHGAVSPDGLHWTLLQDEPISVDGAFDSLNLAWWDESIGKYHMFSRYLDVPGRNSNTGRNDAVWKEGTGEPWVRAIQSSTSDDFIHWTPAEPHIYSEGAPREHFYTNATVRCPGAEHILLSFPKRFLEERRVVPQEEHEYPGVSDTVFMTSRDGRHWDRTFTQGWLRPGRDRRNWTQRGNMVAWGILETAPDELSLYVSEHYEWPTNRLRRLTVRRHGFASMHADGAVGEFVTRPLRFEGDRLTLNFATSAAGSLRVELQEADGTPIAGRTLDDCLPIYGDELDRVVSWTNGPDVGGVSGRPVRLRIALQDADLYAMQFTRGA